MNLNVVLRQLDHLQEALSLNRSNLSNVSHLTQYTLTYEEQKSSTPVVVTFVMVKWGSKYSALYVNSLAHSLRHFTSEDPLTSVSIVCFTDNIDDPELTRDADVQYRSVQLLSPRPHLSLVRQTPPSVSRLVWMVVQGLSLQQ
jgi:hypothetical protein